MKQNELDKCTSVGRREIQENTHSVSLVSEAKTRQTLCIAYRSVSRSRVHGKTGK